MPPRRILAFHLVFGTYGFWLPNDPRGSWSRYVGSREMHKFGDATKTTVRCSVAHARHDHEQRLAAKRALKHKLVQFTGVQARAVARGFAAASAESNYVVHACAVLPDHAHLVISWHERTVRRIASHFKARATQRLHEEELWAEEGQPVWAKGGWSVFLYSAADIKRTIRYVEQNPVHDGKPRQHWDFVVPFSAEMPHVRRRL